MAVRASTHATRLNSASAGTAAKPPFCGRFAAAVQSSQNHVTAAGAVSLGDRVQLMPCRVCFAELVWDVEGFFDFFFEWWDFEDFFFFVLVDGAVEVDVSGAMVCPVPVLWA
jgi:hypothetical protein